MTSDNSFSTAQRIGALEDPRIIRGSVSRTDRVDFVNFRVTARSSFRSVLRGLESNANLTLFNSRRQRIAVSNNPGSQSESIDTVLERGRYFIRVDRRSGETNYRLRLAATPLAAPDRATSEFVGLTRDNSLAFFNDDNLANVNRLRVTGLQSGENLLGIDFRPNTGQLFGLGSSSRLYSINTSTGAATQIGTQPFAIPLSGTSFGFDFNPTVDRIRVVSNTGQNLRLNPDTGAVVDADTATAGTQADGNLNGGSSSIVASGYTNNFSGTTTTVLYGIDSTSDQLFIQNPPNAGTQVAVGPLGVNFSANAGLDIVTENGVDRAFATSGSRLYSVNLSSGAARLLGEVRNGTESLSLIGLAARP